MKDLRPNLSGVSLVLLFLTKDIKYIHDQICENITSTITFDEINEWKMHKKLLIRTEDTGCGKYLGLGWGLWGL